MGGVFQKMGWEDREVKVRREELLKVLRDNRGKHVADHKEACDGYRAFASQRLVDIIATLKVEQGKLDRGSNVQVAYPDFGLKVPVSYVNAYDQVIKMMEMSVEDVISLTAGQFACFVMDSWDWKESWSKEVFAYTSFAPKNR